MPRPRKKNQAHVPPTAEELANGSFLECVGCELEWPLRLTVPSLSRCVNCAREWWRQERQGRVGGRWKKYGLSQNDVDEMLADQKHMCAICSQSIDAQKCHVDHDHATGAIRELLCRRCNLSIGHFSENPELLRVAARYIEKHRGKKASDRPRVMRAVPRVPLRPRKPHHFVTRSGERIDLGDPSIIKRLETDRELKREIDAYVEHKLTAPRRGTKTPLK
jgi:hypothetical protein